MDDFIKEILTKLKISRDEFLKELKKKRFQKIISKHDKIFGLSFDEIRCINPKIIVLMVIFIILYVTWDLKLILVPKALLFILMNLLKEKIQIEILKPFMAQYSNWWFIVPKKFETLRFIQDIQSVHKKIIKNKESRPIVDEIVDNFVRHAIYFIRDFYFGYDQF